MWPTKVFPVIQAAQAAADAVGTWILEVRITWVKVDFALPRGALMRYYLTAQAAYIVYPMGGDHARIDRFKELFEQKLEEAEHGDA